MKIGDKVRHRALWTIRLRRCMMEVLSWELANIAQEIKSFKGQIPALAGAATKVYVLGSFARGEEDLRGPGTSDIDIFFIVKDWDKMNDMWRELAELQQHLKSRTAR